MVARGYHDRGIESSQVVGRLLKLGGARTLCEIARNDDDVGLQLTALLQNGGRHLRKERLPEVQIRNMQQSGHRRGLFAFSSRGGGRRLDAPARESPSAIGTADDQRQADELGERERSEEPIILGSE